MHSVNQNINLIINISTLTNLDVQEYYVQSIIYKNCKLYLPKQQKKSFYKTKQPDFPLLEALTSRNLWIQ